MVYLPPVGCKKITNYENPVPGFEENIYSMKSFKETGMLVQASVRYETKVKNEFLTTK